MEIEWQHNPHFKDTNLCMLDRNILCDITFLTGPTKHEVKCHKFILASRSPVFYTMFCGALPETTTIEVPDIDADTFKYMLRFLYTGETDMNLETVVQQLYVAKKYDIRQLRKQCVTFLENQMSTENVCTILDQAILFAETELQQLCLKFISKNTSEILKTDEFGFLTRTTMAVVLDLDRITCQEIDVYKACKRWAKRECEEKNKDPADDLNLREMLGELLYLIRFPAMVPEVFCVQVASENILTSEEKNDIYRDIIMKTSTSRFKNKARSAKQLFVERFFEASGNWNYTGKQDGISFRVSKPSSLLAVGLYLPNTDWFVKGPLEIYSNETKIAETSVTLNYLTESKYEYVYLAKKLALSPGTTYSMCVRFSGAPTYRGIGDKGKQTIDGVCVEFLNLYVGKSDNSTNVSSGQFHGILLELKHGSSYT